MRRAGAHLACIIVVATTGAASAQGPANYCPIKDFIEVCLEEDQSADAIQARLSKRGWSGDTPANLRSPGRHSAWFIPDEVKFTDVMYQTCQYMNMNAVVEGYSTFCSESDVQHLQDWLSEAGLTVKPLGQVSKAEAEGFNQSIARRMGERIRDAAGSRNPADSFGLAEAWAIERNNVRMSLNYSFGIKSQYSVAPNATSMFASKIFLDQPR